MKAPKRYHEVKALAWRQQDLASATFLTEVGLRTQAGSSALVTFALLWDAKRAFCILVPCLLLACP